MISVENLNGNKRDTRIMENEKKEALADDEEFEKLVLAYDISMRKNSKYEVIVKEERVENGIYSYPAMIFVPRRSVSEETMKV